MEEQILFKNPFLKHLFKNSDFIYEKPEVINEISFERKTLVEDHILFCGDSAGMITPLCGNGMAIAFHSAKILVESIIHFSGKPMNRQALEQNYKKNWSKQFALRLSAGRTIQKLFSNSFVSDIAISTLNTMPYLTQMLVKKTHGKVFF
jgi:flavin-dependent dehydrogenase